MFKCPLCFACVCVLQVGYEQMTGYLVLKKTQCATRRFVLRFFLFFDDVLHICLVSSAVAYFHIFSPLYSVALLRRCNSFCRHLTKAYKVTALERTELDYLGAERLIFTVRIVSPRQFGNRKSCLLIS